jgi:hypothetical protein
LISPRFTASVSARPPPRCRLRQVELFRDERKWTLSAGNGISESGLVQAGTEGDLQRRRERRNHSPACKAPSTGSGAALAIARKRSIHNDVPRYLGWRLVPNTQSSTGPSCPCRAGCSARVERRCRKDKQFQGLARPP